MYDIRRKMAEWQRWQLAEYEYEIKRLEERLADVISRRDMLASATQYAEEMTDIGAD